jgi:hypothetical protein
MGQWGILQTFVAYGIAIRWHVAAIARRINGGQFVHTVIAKGCAFGGAAHANVRRYGANYVFKHMFVVFIVL